jgi:N-acetylmuramoyl-L-alanine amidase
MKDFNTKGEVKIDRVFNSNIFRITGVLQRFTNKPINNTIGRIKTRKVVMWDWLKALFTRREYVTVEPSGIIKKRFALIPGHTRSLYGTETYKGEHEFDWNNDVINMIVKELSSDKIHIVYRNDLKYGPAMVDLAKQCKDLNIDVAIEFHLNAAGIPSARGCEMLVSERKNNLIKARQIITAFSSQFKIKLRHDKGIKKLKDDERGGGFVREMEKIGVDAYLPEPFFCDYKTEDSAQFIESGGKEKYAKFWINQIKNW